MLSSLTAGQLPVESSSMDIVLSLCRSPESPSDQLIKEISRLLKPGGTIVLCHSESASKDTNKVINMCCFELLEFEFDLN